MAKIAETRKRILESAESVFIEKGYDRAKVSDIVKLADAAQGTFYLYFKSKQNCLNVLVHELIDDFQSEIKAEAEHFDNETVRRVISLLVQSIDKHKKLLQIIHFEQSNLDDELPTISRKIKAYYIDVITKAFEHAGLAPDSARKKAMLVDAALARYMMNEVMVSRPDYILSDISVYEMMDIILNDVVVTSKQGTS